MMKLQLKDGTAMEGNGFGAQKDVVGEVVFTTGMVGYPESMTDPSYAGQILVTSYPLIGNYGVSDHKEWESHRIQVSGLVVSRYVADNGHYGSREYLDGWLKRSGVPAMMVGDTRGLVIKLRNEGVMQGAMGKGTFASGWEEESPTRLVELVSTKKPYRVGAGEKTVVVIDCGVKQSIIRELQGRGLRLVVVPWNWPLTEWPEVVDGVVISNGPGDPEEATETVKLVRELMERKMPMLGICLGHQIMTLAAGGETHKLKFGHRGQNQPCRIEGTSRVYLTTQNHGYAVKRLPEGFDEWFVNLNDRSNEGMRHSSRPWLSVQFHPEAAPGPTDTAFVFDEFVELL